MVSVNECNDSTLSGKFIRNKHLQQFSHRIEGVARESLKGAVKRARSVTVVVVLVGLFSGSSPGPPDGSFH